MEVSGSAGSVLFFCQQVLAAARPWRSIDVVRPELTLARVRSIPERTPATTGWVATAHADLDYYEAATALGDLEAPRVPFPRDWPARTFVLSGDRAWIGRRGSRRGHRPEIDLGGWPFDPGVSRLHAVLLVRPGGWALLDPGSAGGTALNYPTARVPADVLTPLVDQDRIHLGVWTTITLRQV